MSAQRTFKVRQALKGINFYPPYLGAGVRVTHIGPDMRTIEVELKLRWWNRNYVGTHFGGSLYAMCDPWFMLMLIENLGRDYIVWDKAATIRFKSPGTGTVTARFHLTQEQIGEVREQANQEGKIEPVFTAEVVDEDGKIVAEVEKLVYVRKKDSRPSQD
jgi:acyl-coenzyme A thioesterase PaaI-like protein